MKRTPKEICTYHLALLALAESDPEYRQILDDSLLRSSLIKSGTLENLVVGVFKEIPSERELVYMNPRFKKVFDRLQQLGEFGVLKFTEELFPINLKEYSNIPLLYTLGDESLLKQKTFTVLGNRSNLDEEDKSYLDNFFSKKYFDKDEPALVTGLRRGCETEAATGFLNRRKNVIGFLGNPLDYFWPKENKELQKRIGRDNLLISPHPVCLGVLSDWEFPKEFFRMMTSNIVSIAEEIFLLNDEGVQLDYDKDIFVGSVAAGWVLNHCKKTGKIFRTTPRNPKRYGWSWAGELEEEDGLLRLGTEFYF